MTAKQPKLPIFKCVRSIAFAHFSQEAQTLMAFVVEPSGWAVLGVGDGAGGGVMRSVNVCGLNVIVHN